MTREEHNQAVREFSTCELNLERQVQNLALKKPDLYDLRDSRCVPKHTVCSICQLDFTKNF